jgi:hypothetical protein
MPAKIKDLIQRDIAVKVEGVVKVYDRAALASEIREYVVTDKIEDELKRILDTFTQVSESLRRGGKPRDVMGIWVSGFFGSGKSHFAKVLGYLLQNEPLQDGPGESCIDAFEKHLSDSSKGRDIRLRLGEVKKTTVTKMVAFEIRSRQSLNNPNSVGEILLGEFFRSIGYSENFIIAQLERRLARRGLLEKLTQVFEKRFGVVWASEQGRDDLATVRRRLAKVLPEVDPKSFPTEDEALTGMDDAFAHTKITAESIADELVAWVNEQKPTGGRVQHLVFVVDEIVTFIGDSNDKIGELNSLAEMIGNKGKGKVWIIATSQQDLEKVVDRTNFLPALVGRLNARFELKPHLVSDGINKVVCERILKKRPARENELRTLYQENEGFLAQLSDLKASRSLGLLSEQAFVEAYPFLPHQIQLAQDIGEALSGFRISGGVRSMISVVMEALQKLGSQDLGTIASFDQVFDALENDLLSQEYLGASGVRSINESSNRVPKPTPIPAARVLKVLYLVQRVTFVPRIAENLAKLLLSRLDEDLPALRQQVDETLLALQEAGYVARDESSGEWKFLNERERSIEQAIQEMIRPGTSRSITMTSIRQQSLEIAKTSVIARKNLNNYTVTHGVTKTPFSFGVYLDGEAVDTGPELEMVFVSPLAPGRKTTIEEIKRDNQTAGPNGRKAWWEANVPEKLELRLKRYQALLNVTSDKRFTDDPSKDTADALSEKRKERDDLARTLAGDLKSAFLQGTLYYGGKVVDLDQAKDLAGEIQTALGQQIPNIYPRFTIADKPVDFAKQIKALLNPAQNALHTVAPELYLFDTQGSLNKESALVATALEVIKDLEDEGVNVTGEILLDAGNSKGFKGFARAPFGWPSEVVRLVLAACFRAGTIYLERQSAAGPAPLYDYKDALDDFVKIKTFEKTTFRLAESSLTVEQIKQASKELIAMGVTGTPESGNALAAAIRQLGGKLQEGVRDAQLRAEAGLPLGDEILKCDGALKNPTTLKDPTKSALAFLQVAPQWRSLKQGLDALRVFLEANRHKDFETSRQLVSLVQNHPLAGDTPDKAALDQSLADLDAIVAGKAVVGRWNDYRAAVDKVHEVYRDAYRANYVGLQKAVTETLAAIRSGPAYAAVPAEQRDSLVNATFGPGAPCCFPDVKLTSIASLISAATKTSLPSLGQAMKALPAYRAEVEAALRALKTPPRKPEQKVYTWNAAAALAGMQFATAPEVDAALEAIAEELKARIKEGFTIQVK